MDKRELKEILIAAIVLTIAFKNVFFGTFNINPMLFAVSFILIAPAFLFHELSHRFSARSLGYYAVFKKWDLGLLLCLFSSFFGFIFAAPGAVVISPRFAFHLHPNHQKKAGMFISASGPLANLILAVIFLFLIKFVILDKAISTLLYYAFSINTWFALFNLLPIPPLDGFKLFLSEIRLWALLFGIALVLFKIYVAI